MVLQDRKLELINSIIKLYFCLIETYCHYIYKLISLCLKLGLILVILLFFLSTSQHNFNLSFPAVDKNSIFANFAVFLKLSHNILLSFF